MSNILPVPTPKDIVLFFNERDGKVIETATLATGTISNKTIDSSCTIAAVLDTAVLKDTSTIVAAAAVTKKLGFNCAGMTAAKTLTFTPVSDENNIFKIDTTGVASGKFLSIKAVNTASDATITMPTATATVATLGLAEAFTGVKTFSVAPVIATITNGAATLTLPSSTGTLAKLTDIGADVRATATVALTQAEIIGMYAAPKQLVAAPAAGEVISVEAIEILHTYSTTQYAGGGACKVQYDSTVNGAGTAISADIDAVVKAASTTNTMNRLGSTILPVAAAGVDMAAAGIVAKGVFLSNASGAYSAGNAGNVLKLRITYRVVTALT